MSCQDLRANASQDQLHHLLMFCHSLGVFHCTTRAIPTRHLSSGIVVTSVAVTVLLQHYQDSVKPLIFVPQETRPEDSRLGSKLTGFKNRLLRPSSASPSPLDSAYDFGALAEDRRDAGHEASALPAEYSGKLLWCSLTQKISSLPTEDLSVYIVKSVCKHRRLLR